jgi:hypothetical protein
MSGSGYWSHRSAKHREPKYHQPDGGDIAVLGGTCYGLSANLSIPKTNRAHGYDPCARFLFCPAPWESAELRGLRPLGSPNSFQGYLAQIFGSTSQKGNSNMAFSDDTKRQIWANSGGRCECTRKSHRHTGPGGRCNAPLYAGAWHAHHRTAQAAGGSDAASNGEALCVPCHKATDTFGTT